MKYAWFLLAVSMAACGGGGGGGSDGATESGFTAVSSDSILNPERGFHDWVDLPYGSDYSYVTAKGCTLAYAGVDLSPFRHSPIPSSFLSNLTSGFARVRQAGIKVVLRFFYSSGFGDPDASKSRVLEHIAQLKPLFQANYDVIAFLEAGFIGAWGEWHASSHGLDQPETRKEILFALLDALPSSRCVLVRTPHYKDLALGGPGPLTPSTAYDGSKRSRIGHHNDGFLGGATDDGTFTAPVDYWRDYVSKETQYVPIGGESDQLAAPRTDAPFALEELARMNYTFLNNRYHPGVLAGWEAAGVLPEISQRLGYRLVVRDSSWTSSVRPGGKIEIDLTIENVGFAPICNRRPMYVVLRNGSAWYAAKISSVDPRGWKGGGESSFTLRVRVPASASEGTYALALWLPDEAPAIRDDPRYAVRFANDGMWENGLNVLTHSFSVSSSAPGSVDSSASTFFEVP